MEYELTCRICHSRLAPCRGILSLEAKDSWLPEPGDAAQYDIIRTENLRSKAFNSFLVESATVGRPIIYPGYAPVNDSLAWSFDPTFLASDAESPDTTLASIFTTSLQVTSGSAATALSTIATILASLAYYDQFPNFAETAHGVSTTYFQPFLFPQILPRLHGGVGRHGRPLFARRDHHSGLHHIYNIDHSRRPLASHLTDCLARDGRNDQEQQLCHRQRSSVRA